MRRFLFPLLIGLLLVSGAPLGAHAEDVDDMTPAGEPTDPGYRFYEKTAKKILRTAGIQVWEAAKHASRLNLYQFAHEQAERALRFDPNQKDAREYLKFEKKGKQWVRNAEDYAKLKRQNVRGGSNGKMMSVESFQAIIKKWKEERLGMANKFVGARYAKLAAACASKGFPLQAKKGYEYALRMDPGNKAARKGLGFKKFGRVWLTAKQDKARKDAGKTKVVKDESGFDMLFGVTHNKVESLHFRVESMLPLDEISEIAHTMETAYAFYLADFDLDPTSDLFRGRKLVLCYMQDGDQWNKWVDRRGGDELTRSVSGTGDEWVYGNRIKEGASTPASRKDNALHRTAHWINHRLWERGKKAWLDEGLAYYYSLKVQETCLTHCVALKKGDYGRADTGGIKDWKEPQNWKPLVKALVRKKNDTPLRTLLHQPITKLEFDATVKAWSMLTWMMDDDRDRFLEFWRQMRAGGKQDAIIEGLWETHIEGLDELWKAYVLRNY